MRHNLASIEVVDFPVGIIKKKIKIILRKTCVIK